MTTSHGPDRFAEFYAAQFRQIAAQLSVYLGDRQEANDVAQDAFVRAWQRWSTISRYEDPATWVRRVAWNLATSRIRRWRMARRYQRGQSEPSVPGPDPQRMAIRDALADLPDGRRRAVVLHYLVGPLRERLVPMWGVSDVVCPACDGPTPSPSHR